MTKLKKKKFKQNFGHIFPEEKDNDINIDNLRKTAKFRKYKNSLRHHNSRPTDGPLCSPASQEGSPASQEEVIEVNDIFVASSNEERGRKITHPQEVEEELQWLKDVQPPADRIVFEELLHEKPASHLFNIFSSVEDIIIKKKEKKRKK